MFLLLKIAILANQIAIFYIKNPWGPPLGSPGGRRPTIGFYEFILRSLPLVTRLLSPISRYFTTWNGFAVSKSPRIQSSILKVIDFFTVYERFRFLLNLSGTEYLGRSDNWKISGPGPGSGPGPSAAAARCAAANSGPGPDPDPDPGPGPGSELYHFF